MSDETKDCAGAYFTAICDRYDEAIVRCVPRYEEMLDQLLDVVPQERADGHVLELGVGSGALTLRHMLRYPLARIVGVDASHEMLEATRARIRRADACDDLALELVHTTFEELELEPASLDLVTSSISLHHLRDKGAFFAKVARWLRPGGALVFADQFLGATTALHERNWRHWLRFLDDAGATRSEVDSWIDHAARHDVYESVGTHFHYLTSAGFESVDCIWRHLIWGVVHAIKAEV
ncbi:MAG: class I SAM-dependent methyltransferase [Planctomycetes bacterium]|nr:class I SAM-dependent methyltransferase [Planctomycetota bacterium]